MAASESPQPTKPSPRLTRHLTHALHAPVPRRAKGASSGLGSRGQARQASARGARVQGAVAVQQGEDALLLRQRPEAGLVRFLLRQERQHFRLRYGVGRRQLPGSGRAPGANGRRAAAESLSARRGARGAPQIAARRHGAGGKILRGDAGFESRRQGARLSGRPRPRSRHAIEVPARLCAGRALRAEGASGLARRFHRGHGGSGSFGRRRRHSGAVRPFPRPRHVPDYRSARAGDRLRRPRAGEGRAGEIPELAGDAALSQRRHALQHRRRPRGRARRQVYAACARKCRRSAGRGRRLCRRHRHGARRLSGDRRPARHRAHRGSTRSAVEDGGRAHALLRRRQPLACAPPTARSIWPCRG